MCAPRAEVTDTTILAHEFAHCLRVLPGAGLQRERLGGKREVEIAAAVAADGAEGRDEVQAVRPLDAREHVCSDEVGGVDRHDVGCIVLAESQHLQVHHLVERRAHVPIAPALERAVEGDESQALGRGALDDRVRRIHAADAPAAHFAPPRSFLWCAITAESNCITASGPRHRVPGPPYIDALPSDSEAAANICAGSTTYMPSSRRRRALRCTPALLHIASFIAGTKTTGARVAATVIDSRSVHAASPSRCRAFAEAGITSRQSADAPKPTCATRTPSRRSNGSTQVLTP